MYKKIRLFILAFVIIPFTYSCKWEKVDYGKLEDDVDINTKVSSFTLSDIPKQRIGVQDISIPITIEGLYKDAKEYRLSELNSMVKVFYVSPDLQEKVSVPFVIVNNEGLKINVSLPHILSTGQLSVFLNDVEVASKTIEVDDIVWELKQINGDADSWTDKANIHFSIDVDDSNISFIASRLLATITEEGTSDSIPLNITTTQKEEDLTITNLKPSTTYTIRYYIEGTNKEITQKIRTEDIETIPNNSFEEWSQEKKAGNYWELEFPFNKDNIPEKHWDTLNRLTCRYGLDSHKVTLRYRANSSTIPTNDAHSGNKAAIVRTVAYGANATAAGSWSLGVTVSTGSLYLGSFNDDILKDESNQPNLGIPFTSRPKEFSFWAKYKPVNKSDNFIAEMVLLASDGTKVAEAVLPKQDAKATVGNDYKKYNISLDYKTTIKKPAKMYIRFVSGEDKSDKTTSINYGSISNSAEHIGSKLYIDDISITY